MSVGSTTSSPRRAGGGRPAARPRLRSSGSAQSKTAGSSPVSSPARQSGGHDSGRGRPGRGGRRRRHQPRSEDRRRRVALDVGVLDDEQPAGPQQPRAGALDRAEARRARRATAPQRQRRVVLADLGVADQPVRGDVRRVATTTSTCPSSSGKRARPASPRRRSTPTACRARLRSAQANAVGSPLDGVDARARHLVRRRERDGPRPGAQVDDDAAARPLAASPRIIARTRPRPRSPAAGRTRLARPRARDAGSGTTPMRCWSGSPASRASATRRAASTRRSGVQPREDQAAARDAEHVRGERSASAVDCPRRRRAGAWCRGTVSASDLQRSGGRHCEHRPAAAPGRDRWACGRRRRRRRVPATTPSRSPSSTWSRL